MKQFLPVKTRDIAMESWPASSRYTTSQDGGHIDVNKEWQRQEILALISHWS